MKQFIMQCERCIWSYVCARSLSAEVTERSLQHPAIIRYVPGCRWASDVSELQQKCAVGQIRPTSFKDCSSASVSDFLLPLPSVLTIFAPSAFVNSNHWLRGVQVEGCQKWQSG